MGVRREVEGKRNGWKEKKDAESTSQKLFPPDNHSATVRSVEVIVLTRKPLTLFVTA